MITLPDSSDVLVVVSPSACRVLVQTLVVDKSICLLVVYVVVNGRADDTYIDLAAGVRQDSTHDIEQFTCDITATSR